MRWCIRRCVNVIVFLISIYISESFIIQNRKSLVILKRSFVQKSFVQLNGESNLAEKLKQTELLVTFPLESINLDQLLSLKKLLVGYPYSEAITKSKLTQLVERTPFCPIVEFLSVQNFCIFINSITMEENYSLICGWLKKRELVADNPTSTTDGNPNPPRVFPLLLCKKGHMIKINMNQDNVYIDGLNLS